MGCTLVQPARPRPSRSNASRRRPVIALSSHGMNPEIPTAAKQEPASPPPATVAAALRQAAAGLSGAREEARADAEVLLAAAVGQPRAWLYAHADDPLAEHAQRRFEGLLARRRRG